MIVKFEEVSINLDAITFTVPKGNMREVHTISGESISIPEESTAGYFSNAPTIKDLMEMAERQAQEVKSGIVRPNIVVK